jgi:hydrogenase nickel incorporation protein HypA/HybF
VHELSLSRAIVDTALRHAAGRRVTVVKLRVGSLRQVVPDSLSFYFEIVARDTECEGAKLELELIPAVLQCGACDSRWDPALPPLASHGELPRDGLPPLPSFRCPACEGPHSEVVRGDEFEVEWIEVNDPTLKEEPCIAPR